MRTIYEQNELENKIVVFYNTENLEVLNIVKPYNSPFNINEFKSNIQCENIGYFINDSIDYDNYCSNINNYNKYIDVDSKKLCFEIKKIENYDNSRNLYYNRQDVKRNYTKEQVSSMYNTDYIDFNLKNIIKSGVFDFRFIELNELKLRNRIVEKRWDTFCSDPFLQNMSEDKIKLGLDIKKNGTYYPLIVSTLNPTDENLYIFEGNHRAISLKLLQSMGELPMDYKILCIVIPCNYMIYKTTDIKTPLKESIMLRCILENIYGSGVIGDDNMLSKAVNKIHSDGNSLINDYTIEYRGYNIEDIIFTIHSYPLWVRDLIFNYRQDILPSPIINNEEIFNKWKEL